MFTIDPEISKDEGQRNRNRIALADQLADIHVRAGYRGVLVIAEVMIRKGFRKDAREILVPFLRHLIRARYCMEHGRDPRNIGATPTQMLASLQGRDVIGQAAVKTIRAAIENGREDAETIRHLWDAAQMFCNMLFAFACERELVTKGGRLRSLPACIQEE